MAAKVIIDSERCKCCEYCVISCPKKLILIGTKMNSHGYKVAEIQHPEDCIMCKSCATMCPESAISIYKE